MLLLHFFFKQDGSSKMRLSSPQINKLLQSACARLLLTLHDFIWSSTLVLHENIYHIDYTLVS